MKKFFNYYILIILILFIVYNFILDELIIMGLLYKIIMILIIIINIIVLIIFKKEIKYKTLVIIIYWLIWIIGKDIFQCLFAFSNILILCIIDFMESKLIKIISILIIIYIYIFFLPIYFGLMLTFGINLDKDKYRNDIYPETHYYCNNNYEAYVYSAGAMDSFHYSIGKYYDILNYNDIINIVYRKRNEKTFEDYKHFIQNNNCKLVGDINESR